MNATLFVVQASNAFFQAYYFHHMFDVYLMMFAFPFEVYRNTYLKKRKTHVIGVALTQEP